jgi:N-acyl homoserine lactone hydrolase
VEIRALRTGTVRIANAMARGSGVGPVRFARMLRDRTFTAELPVHAWLIVHPDGPILVDTGEVASTRDPRFARFEITREQEIDRALAAEGIAAGDLRRIVLTHVHGDHANGLSRLAGPEVLASSAALRGMGRWLAKRGARPSAFAMSGGAFGAFPASAALSADGLVRAVPTPGHAPGHVAIVVDEGERHVMLAGDSAYSRAQLLDLCPDGVSLSAALAVRSMRRIVEHARRHPTVFLPSHDPDSERRLSEREALVV